EVGDVRLHGAPLLLEVDPRVVELLGGPAIVLDLEQRIELLLAVGWCQQEIGGEGALWHAESVVEEVFEGDLGLHAQGPAQKIGDVLPLLDDARLHLGVVDIPGGGGAAAAHCLILAVVQRGEEGDGDCAGALTLADKLLLVVAKCVEEGEAYGLHQRRFARAVVAAYGDCASGQGDAGAAVALDILEINSCDAADWVASEARCDLA